MKTHQDSNIRKLKFVAEKSGLLRGEDASRRTNDTDFGLRRVALHPTDCLWYKKRDLIHEVTDLKLGKLSSFDGHNTNLHGLFLTSSFHTLLQDTTTYICSNQTPVCNTLPSLNREEQ